MERVFVNKLHDHLEEEVVIKGWVDTRRDHGKLTFLDIRDASGLIQSVALPAHEQAHKQAKELRPEWVVTMRGNVNKRPEKMVNADEPNGDIELEVLDVKVLNTSKTPPFEIHEDTRSVDENARLTYRYLDLRSERMRDNMITRSSFVQKCREFLFSNDFKEIETPLLTKSTPEGSRDFVVPSRLHPGKFYALPQSPQQYKQLLMTAGFERYFQIARAVRDEDLRADRGFEHSQIDLEMSFVDADDVMKLVENMITSVVEEMGYEIKEKPFPRITYAEAIEKYGDDKFDLRSDEEKEKGDVLAYAWVHNFPLFEKTNEGGWTFSHNPFSAPIPEHTEWLLDGKNVEDITAAQYDLVCNGYESGGGSIRSHTRELLEATYNVMGYTKEEIEESVGHMLQAFDYGTPPHGGIALGIERNVMNLTGEQYLREVQAFPMSRGGQTAVMDAPSALSQEQLQELHITIEDEEDENT